MTGRLRLLTEDQIEEIHSATLEILREPGIAVENEEALAVDVIRRVGRGGPFLGEKHTRLHHLEEVWRPSDVICRLSLDTGGRRG